MAKSDGPLGPVSGEGCKMYERCFTSPSRAMSEMEKSGKKKENKLEGFVEKRGRQNQLPVSSNIQFSPLIHKPPPVAGQRSYMPVVLNFSNTPGTSLLVAKCASLKVDVPYFLDNKSHFSSQFGWGATILSRGL